MNIETIYQIFISLPAFCLGAILVSYFGVVTERGWKKSSAGRSHCDHCKKTIPPQYLIPIFSFLYLYFFNKGRSHCCQRSLSIEYFLSEIFGGLCGLLIWWHVNDFGLNIATVIFSIVALIFLFLAIYDLWKYEIDIIPLGIMLALVCLSFIIDPENSAKVYGYEFISLSTLLFGLVAALVVGMLIVISKGKGLGVGDVFVVAFIAMTLGWQQALVSLQITIYVAVIFGLIVAKIKNKFHGLIIPLVPFLLLGWLVAINYSQWIIDTYISFTFGLY